MKDKLEWDDAPEWAKHLWSSKYNGSYCWSNGDKLDAKACLASCHEDEFALWPDCWDLVRSRS